MFECYKIERHTLVLNDMDCIEYDMYVPIEKVNIVSDRYGKTVSEDDSEKYFEKIKKEIDFDKEVYHDNYFEIMDRRNLVRFEIYTRDKNVIKKERKIKEKLNLSEYNRINFLDDGWIEIGGYNNTTKNGMKELEEILDLKDWSVCFDGFMEEMYIAILPNGEV